MAEYNEQENTHLEEVGMVGRVKQAEDFDPEDWSSHPVVRNVLNLCDITMKPNLSLFNA